MLFPQTRCARCIHLGALTLLLFLLPAPRLHAQSALQDIDVFGSDQLSAGEVKERWGAQLEQLSNLYPDRVTNAYAQLKAAIAGEIEAAGNFAFVKVSVIESYSANRPIHITIDLVDPEDAAHRIPFEAAPRDTLADPAGLIEAWQHYEDRSFQLFREGALGSIACNAYHCLWGFNHAELESLGIRFDTEVPTHKDALASILKHDHRAAHRAAAAFLLAHVSDVEELIEILIPAITDTSALVRNNAMRVLASIARNHEGVPVAPIARALTFPTATDRNKALATVRFLVDTPARKRLVADTAGTTLLDMLKLVQPINHKLAHVVLQRLSGEDFGARNYPAWEQWLADF